MPATATNGERVSTGEIARRLGRTKARVSQLAAEPGFPEPVEQWGQTKVYRWDEVASWLTARGYVVDEGDR